MLIRWAEIYAKTEILSPVDRDIWRVIAETSKLTALSRVIELASGKGAFANYLGEKFRCSVEGFEINSEFVDYSNSRAGELGLQSKVKFTKADVNCLDPDTNSYDLSACLGALYIFRERGWNSLVRATKPNGYLVVSEMICKRIPPPKELVGIFFEESNPILTLEDARRWYETRGAEILREETCTSRAWLEYYDLTKEALSKLSRAQPSNAQFQAEVDEARNEDRLFRKYGHDYIDYVTFIMRNSKTRLTLERQSDS